MTFRATTTLLLLVVSGCSFDFGSESRPPEVIVDPIVPFVSDFDGGTSTTISSGDCVFVPCGDPYGTSCGWVCSGSTTTSGSTSTAPAFGTLE